MGFLVSQQGRLVAIPPPPFVSVSPLESMRSGGAIPPPLKRGISAILPRYPMKTRQMGAIRDMGGISHWAAKGGRFGYSFFFSSGEGKGEFEAPGRGGGRSFLRIPGRGGVFSRRGG